MHLTPAGGACHRALQADSFSELGSRSEQIRRYKTEALGEADVVCLPGGRREASTHPYFQITMATATATNPELPAGYALHVGLPEVPVYRHVRAASGLTPVEEQQASRAIAGTWYGCHVRYTATSSSSSPATQEQQQQQQQQQPESSHVVAGMGRIISDGGWYFHVADMAVLPEHQRRGLGVAVMRELLAYIEQNRPAEGVPLINLLADPPGISLYKKMGFVHSTDRDEHGMIYVGGSQEGAKGFVDAGKGAQQ